MNNDPNTTSDSGAAFESDVDDIYGTEEETDEEEDPAQPTAPKEDKKCSG